MNSFVRNMQLCRVVRVLLVVAMLCVATSSLHAQYNKAYFFWMGREHIIENRYRDAIRSLNILLGVDKDAYEGYFLRGVAKYNLEDLLGADADFSQAININPVYTLAYQYRAITRARLGNYEDALADFAEAISLRPDQEGIYFSRGVTLLLSGRFGAAIEDFDTFIHYDPKVADAYLNRGLCYLSLKDTVRARAEFDMAIRTNRESPDGYNRRGSLLMEQNQPQEALADFNQAIVCDTTYLPSYFNRALAYSKLKRPGDALRDFDHVLRIDSTSAVTYFNRAILRTQIGDYNSALEDYNQVAFYSPDNVLVYYNRALLYSRLNDPHAAIKDYTRAIELYPDFAAAYINRAELKRRIGDMRGSKSDVQIANRKIAEYRSRLWDTTSISSYADTSRRFNRLLSFDTKLTAKRLAVNQEGKNISLLPLFKFSMHNNVKAADANAGKYYVPAIDTLVQRLGGAPYVFSNRTTDIATDSLVRLSRQMAEHTTDNYEELFRLGVAQSLVRQYTSSVGTFSVLVELYPTDPFVYINRSTVRAEMTDFISSISQGYGRITIDSDPANKLRSGTTRTYDYDEAIADLNKAAKLRPDLAYIYYNRGNLQAISGRLPEAFDDYTRAIELNPDFAEAYYNRGLVQIYMKDTRKGCLDVSKAGELGVEQAYTVLNLYARPEHD